MFEYVYTGGRRNGKKKMMDDFLDALRYANINFSNPEPFVKAVYSDDEESTITEIIEVEPINARSVVAGTFMTGHCPKCKKKDLLVLENPIENKTIMRCAVCGYLEEYCSDELMENVEHMEKFKKGLRLFGRMP